MITYPTIFFGLQGGKIKEDFDDYDVGSLPVYPQIWQYTYHQWLVKRNPSKFAGFTWKDYGVSGAFDSFDDYEVGEIELDSSNLLGQGNFEIRKWTGIHGGFYREPKGQFTSADELRMYQSVYFDWGSEAPFDGYKSDYWSLKLITQFVIPKDGNYRFYIERDQACRMWVGRENGFDNLIFDKWGVPTVSGQEASNTFFFTSGISNMLIHFYEDADNAKLKLSWSGPDFPLTPMLPSDFGNEGYVRIYTPFHGGSDQGKQSINFDGSYRFGYSYEDGHRNASNLNLNFEGNYERGVINFDQKRSSATSNIYHSGYYVHSRKPSHSYSQGHSIIDPRGFYSYQSAITHDADQASGTLTHWGFHVPKNVSLQTNEKNHQNIRVFGFHATGIIRPDGTKERVNQELDHHGFYAERVVRQYDSDQSKNLISSLGNYFPIYVYTKAEDSAANIINPVGYFLTGYPLFYYQNQSNVALDYRGHHAYYLVTFDQKANHAVNTLVPRGLYVYKSFDFYNQEKTSNLIGFNAYYYPRYLANPYNDQAIGRVNTEGDYYPRYLGNRYNEPAKNVLDPRGFYADKNAYQHSRDEGHTLLYAEGHHITGYAHMKGDSQGSQSLKAEGNYFYQYLYTRDADSTINTIYHDGIYYNNKKPHLEIDSALNVVLCGGEYRSIYVYFNSIDSGTQILDIQGNYFFRYSPFKAQSSFASTTISPVGYHIDGFVETDTLQDKGMNSISMVGNKFYRFLSGAGSDIANANFNLGGMYYYRFAHSQLNDVSSGRMNFDGVYYTRWLKNQYTNRPFNVLRLDGEYSPIYAYCHLNDTSKSVYDLNGQYYSRRLNNHNQDMSINLVGMEGDIFYARVPTRDVDYANNTISAEGDYFTRFVPCFQSNLSHNMITCMGSYGRESYLVVDSGVISVDFSSEVPSYGEIQDFGQISADFSGVFNFLSASSTMEYWVEIYRRSPYTISKTQQYFNI